MFGQGFQRQADLVEHFVEQVGLVLKVPVDRTARYTGMPGDVLQAGMGDPAFEEQLLGSREDGVAGFLRIFFGSAHGDPGDKTGLRS